MPQGLSHAWMRYMHVHVHVHVWMSTGSSLYCLEDIKRGFISKCGFWGWILISVNWLLGFSKLCEQAFKGPAVLMSSLAMRMKCLVCLGYNCTSSKTGIGFIESPGSGHLETSCLWVINHAEDQLLLSPFWGTRQWDEMPYLRAQLLHQVELKTSWLRVKGLASWKQAACE